MRNDIYQMWSIQEGLLQQYRGMAITLMGLISAGILVAISHISANWATLDGILADPEKYSLRAATDGVIYLMLVTLLVLGWRARRYFRNITRQRGQIVTFYQNLLLAEENGVLETIAGRHGIPYPVELLGVLRRISNPNFRPLTFEKHIAPENFVAFEYDIAQTDTANEDPNTRHDDARKFLSSALFNVFLCFFSLTGLYAALTIIHFF